MGDPPDAAVIDLTYSAEERPDARLRAPLVESVQVEDPADVAVHVIAHPAAIALALFMRRLHANDPIRNAVIQIFAPASEHGAPGVHELQQQTVSLLSFKNLPKDDLRHTAQLQPAGALRRGSAGLTGGIRTAH